MKEFFTGSEKTFTKDEADEMIAILYSPAFQQAYCNFLIHSSKFTALIIIQSSILSHCFLELYVKYRKKFDNPDQPFNGTHCNIKFFIEDFVNLMSVTYNKGHFILGAEANGTALYDLYPDVGTDQGICKTIKPSVDFHAELTDQRARDNYRIKLGDKVLSGERNGLTVILDVEHYDHGYVPAKGSGVFMVVNHHGDKPILNSGRIKLKVSSLMRML